MPILDHCSGSRFPWFLGSLVSHLNCCVLCSLAFSFKFFQFLYSYSLSSPFPNSLWSLSLSWITWIPFYLRSVLLLYYSLLYLPPVPCLPYPFQSLYTILLLIFITLITLLIPWILIWIHASIILGLYIGTTRVSTHYQYYALPSCVFLLSSLITHSHMVLCSGSHPVPIP